MSSVIVAKGGVASGKTTWATQVIYTLPGDWVRVNRDDFRGMLNGGDPRIHYGTSREKPIEIMTVELRNEAVRFALEKGLNVIVDEVNINSRTFNDVKSIAIEMNIMDPNFECEITEKIFYVSLEEAMIRNARRDKSVDPVVLEKIWTALGGESLKTSEAGRFEIEKRDIKHQKQVYEKPNITFYQKTVNMSKGFTEVGKNPRQPS